MKKRKLPQSKRFFQIKYGYKCTCEKTKSVKDV